jgi:hypothetical protein
MTKLTKLMTILLLVVGAISAIEWADNKYITATLGVLVAFCAIEIIRFKAKPIKEAPPEPELPEAPISENGESMDTVKPLPEDQEQQAIQAVRRTSRTSVTIGKKN